ncbi:MAG: ABC transporter substrate-binding protein [Spirochaetia bacterium]
MKRTVLFSGILLLIAVSVWSEGEQEKSGVEGPKIVTLYDWEASSTNLMVEGFNASHQDIQINHQLVPAADYETKILTLLAGGIDMDLYMQKNQTHKFAHFGNGFIEVLDPYIEKFDADISLVDAYRTDITIEGQVVALPYRGAGTYLYYNKKLFDEAGEQYPTVYVENGTWTWEKYREVAQNIASGDGKVWGSFMAPWGGPWQVPSLWQTGDPIISAEGQIIYDPEAVVKAYKNRKILESTKAQPELSFIKATKLHYSQAFFQGNLGMLIIGEWFPGMLQTAKKDNLFQGFTWDDWGITYIPTNEEHYSSPGGATFGHVAAVSKNKDAAFQVLAYMSLDPKGAKEAAEAGLMPAVIGEEVTEVLAGNIPDPESLGYYIAPFPRENPVNKYASPRDDFISRLMEEYLITDMSDEELLKRFQKGMEEVVNSVD